MAQASKRIAVVGTGANGAAIAADLARAGRDVTLIDQWPENVAAIRASGIDVRLPDERFNVAAPTFNLCDVATMRRPFDVVLVLVKTYDTRWAVQLIEPLVAPSGLVIGAQNGMTMDVVADVVGAERTLGCVIETGGAMWEPGVVERDTPPSKAWFAIGAFDHRTVGRENEGVDVLRHSGTVEVYADIRAAKWMKLVVNAAEVAPSAVLDLSLKDAIETPGVRDFMLEVGCEAISVLRRASIDIIPILGLPDLDPDDPRGFVAKLLDSIIYGFAQPHSKVTVLQDWMKGRRSEVDDMNGVVVRKGQEMGHPTPYNRRALDVALRIERGELAPDRSNLDALLAPLG
jgi:2-dehydropantoate 2-reductase